MPRLELMVTLPWGFSGVNEPDVRSRSQEWPPSPLRLFRALVSASRKCADGSGQSVPDGEHSGVLRWLERQAPPSIRVRGAEDSRAWMAITSPGPANICRQLPSEATEDSKELRAVTTRYRGAQVVYTWHIDPADQAAAQRVLGLAERLESLGRSQDFAMAAGQVVSDDQAARGGGSLYTPAEEGSSMWVPRPGCFDACVARHRSHGTGALFHYGAREIGYARDADRSFRAFALRTPDEGRYRVIDPLLVRSITEKLRHWAVSHLGPTLGSELLELVSGHAAATSAPLSGQHVHYLGVPDTAPRKSGYVDGRVRHVAVCGDVRAVAAIGRALDGVAIDRLGRPVSRQDPEAWVVFRAVPDRVVAPVVGASRVWASVTPVVWERYPVNDLKSRRLGRLRERVRGGDPAAQDELVRLETLIRDRTGQILIEMLRHAGVEPALLESYEIITGPMGAVVPHPAAYNVQDKYLRSFRAHVRLVFKEAIRGPLMIGKGRYVGLGLLCAASW